MHSPVAIVATVEFSGVLIMGLAHLSFLLFLDYGYYVRMCGGLFYFYFNWLSLILHLPSSYSGPYMFLNTGFSNTTNVFSALFQGVKFSDHKTKSTAR